MYSMQDRSSRQNGEYHVSVLSHIHQAKLAQSERAFGKVEGELGSRRSEPNQSYRPASTYSIIWSILSLISII